MTIKIAEQAVLKPLFISTVTDLIEARRKSLVKRRNDLQIVLSGITAERRTRWEQQQYLKSVNDLKGAEMQLAAYNAGGEGLGDARRSVLDYTLLRLRRIPFEFYDVRERDRPRQTWLIAKTKRMTTVVDSKTRGYNNETVDRSYHGTYEHGPYYLSVLTSSLGTTRPIWHIIPADYPQTTKRHLHAFVEEQTSRNPLDWEQRTCWGNFTGIVNGLWEDYEIAEIFRILYTFAYELNFNSMLVRPWNSIQHMRRVS